MPATRGRRVVTRILILGGSTLAALLAAEVGFRVRAQRANAETLERALSQPVQLMKNGEAPLAGIIRLSQDDRITYELRPNLKDVRFKGAPVSTDSRGFRSPEVTETRADDTVTIIGLGDSMMFGQGVADGQSYLDVLRRQLVEHHPEQDWRVVNTGVTGYNTVMEVATLETKCLGLDPDLVILGVYANDYDPPNYVREEDDALDLTRSFLAEFIAERTRPPTTRRGIQAEGLVYRGIWEQEHTAGAPRRYEGLHGPASFERAVRRLRDLSREHEFELLALATVDFMQVEEMMDLIESLDIPSLRLQSRIESHVSAATGRPFTWDDYAHSDLVLNPEDVHPSARQHALVGQALYQQLVAAGHVSRWLQRTKPPAVPR